MFRAMCAAAFAAFAMHAAAADRCTDSSTLTVGGTVHGISTMREEPQAAPETYFTIRVDTPICGAAEITANTIGPIACSEGEYLEAMGTFSPPSKMFHVARLKLTAPVTCRARP